MCINGSHHAQSNVSLRDEKTFFRRLRLELIFLLICVIIGVAVGLASGAGHLSAETLTGITAGALFLSLAVTDRLFKI